MNSVVSDDTYLKILKIISENVDKSDLTSFDTEEIEKRINDNEKIILHAFIKEAVELEIITQTSHYKNNIFKFNNSYAVYIKIQKSY